MKLVALFLSVFALAACVSSSKHQKLMSELEGQLQEQRAANDENKRTIEGLEQKLLSTTKDKGELKSSLDEMKKAMEEMRARQAEERKRLKEFQDLTARFKRLTDNGTLSVRIVDGKMVVSLGSDVLFPSGSAKLSKDGIAAIKEVGTQLAAIAGKRYQVEGHTDNVPISTANFASNWELASSRALTVVKAMIEAGMPAERVSAASFADTAPVQSNATVEGKAANRRIAIVVVPDLSSLPGYDELQKYAQ